MPPKRSKRIAQKFGQADQQPVAALTPEEIFVAPTQLLEGQRQIQQASTQPTGSQLEGSGCDQEPSQSNQCTQASPSRAGDVREVINNRRAARDDWRNRATRGLAKADLARNRGDLRHTINRHRSQSSQRAPH